MKKMYSILPIWVAMSLACSDATGPSGEKVEDDPIGNDLSSAVTIPLDWSIIEKGEHIDLMIGYFQISPKDKDVFRFHLQSKSAIFIQSFGRASVQADLFSGEGEFLRTADLVTAPEGNRYIEHFTLWSASEQATTYLLSVEGLKQAEGDYGLSIQVFSEWDEEDPFKDVEFLTD